MTSMSLRELRMFPCGACAALVRTDDGCEHMSPPSQQRKPRRSTLSATRDGRFDGRNAYALRRLADSPVMCDLLRRAVEADGAPVGTLAKRDRHPANGLVRAGLLESTRRGGDYMITSKGREVWARVLAL